MTITLLILSLLLTGVFFFYAFLLKAPGVPRWRFVGGFLVFLALSAVIASVALQENKAAGELSTYIDPYPSATEAIWVPPVLGEKSRTWILKTADSPEAVLQFHRDPSHLRGWSIREDGGGNLFLRKGSQCLNIMVAQNAGPPTVQETTILYTLHKRC